MSVEMVQLRMATPSDCHLIWKWANDPDVRKASFSTSYIPWEDHKEWFRAKLRDPNCVFFIASYKEQLIGQVRFEIDGDEAVISLSVAASHRYKGLSSVLIESACRKLFETTNVNVVTAFIKAHNRASISAFEKAHFKGGQPTLVSKQNAIRLSLNRVELI